MTGVTIFFGLLLVTVLVLLALELIEKPVLAMLAAFVCLISGYLLIPSIREQIAHSAGSAHSVPLYIQYIDWATIGVIIGTTIFVEIVARSGVFTWAAVKMMKLSGGSTHRMLIYLSILTVIFSAFLNNVTAMIIIGSLTVVVCKRLKLDPMPFLMTEGILTNVGGLLTLISSIPNIILGRAGHIGYTTFLLVAAPYVIVATAMTLWISIIMFADRLPQPASEEEAEALKRKIAEFDEWEAVQDMRFFWGSIVALGILILAFAFKDYIPVLQDMGLEIIALGAGVIMLLLKPGDVEETFERIEWSMVFFFVGLFIVLGVMDAAGVLDAIGTGITAMLSTGRQSGIALMVLVSATASGLTDNIPLASVLGKILTPETPKSVWWAAIFGCNLGGNATPIGSASTVVAVMFLKKHGTKLSFIGFVKIGGVFAAAQVALAIAYCIGLDLLL